MKFYYEKGQCVHPNCLNIWINERTLCVYYDKHDLNEISALFELVQKMHGCTFRFTDDPREMNSKQARDVLMAQFECDAFKVVSALKSDALSQYGLLEGGE